MTEFREQDLSGARFHGVKMQNVKMTDMWVVNTEISGMIAGLHVNGVDVMPYVNAELNKLYPERMLLRPNDPEELRTAWAAVGRLWDALLERAQSLPEATLHASVDGEWSFVETLRHLVFAIDRWITAPVLEEEKPYDPIGVAPSIGRDDEARALGLDLEARPSFAEALDAYRARTERVAKLIAICTPAELARPCVQPGMGTPSVLACLHVVLTEEWAHWRYASRDLDALTQ